MSPDYADVVVVGAGIQGLSAGYHLAQLGLRVVVVEREQAIGRGSSGRSGSMLMKSRESRPKIALSLYSFDWFDTFRDRFGEELLATPCGFLSLVPEELSVRYRREHELRRAMGVPSELLDPAEIRKLAPAVRVDGITFGVYCGDDTVIDSAQLLRAYARAIKTCGGEILLDRPVSGIRVQDGRAVGVEATGGAVLADWVINAAGPCANRVMESIGVRLPFDNRRRSLYRIRTDDPALQQGPMVEDAGSEWYFRGLGADTVLVGMGLEALGAASDEIDVALLPQVIEQARRRAPSIAEGEVLSGTSGFRPLTSDLLPLVGPIDGVDRLVVSCGWGGEGIMHSPAGGAITASWVTGDDAKLPVDLDPSQFLVNRFNNMEDQNGY